jgi:hypothetical protein
MEMSLLSVEVDGALHNPAVSWAIGIWTVLLATAAFIAARRFRTNRRTRFTIVVALLTISTPVAVRMVASLFYILPARSFVAVHFWGFSPLYWIAPPVAVLVFAAVIAWPTRREAAV